MHCARFGFQKISHVINHVRICHLGFQLKKKKSIGSVCHLQGVYFNTHLYQ